MEALLFTALENVCIVLSLERARAAHTLNGMNYSTVVSLSLCSLCSQLCSMSWQHSGGWQGESTPLQCFVLCSCAPANMLLGTPNSGFLYCQPEPEFKKFELG